jgi:hypothetical protein
MKSAKLEAAEALYSLLSTFHEVNGLALLRVQETGAEDCLVEVTLDFGATALVLAANEQDDSIDLRSANATATVPNAPDEATATGPWGNYTGKQFGWGWITINQQGYLDGVILSFEGITPQLLVTVAASSLQIQQIDAPLHPYGRFHPR